MKMEKRLKISTRIKHRRTYPIEGMDTNNQQAMTHVKDRNSGNMHYNCEPCNDLGSCSHTTHTSHSMGHKYAFHIRKTTISYTLSLSSGHQQAQRQTFGQKLLIFSKTFISSQTALNHSLKVYSLDSLCAVFENTTLT